MTEWKPFLVIEKELIAPPRNQATHMVVLREKNSVDLEIMEGDEIFCHKSAHVLNSTIKCSLNNFLNGIT